jgi:hypothetical protein
MSRDQVLGAFDLSQPEWCQDFLGRDQLIPGGVKLDVASLGVAYAAVTVTVAYTAAKVYAGTGNGLMTGPTVSAAAVKEVWTVRLKTAAANGGTFSVTGSVSGATADAVVGVAYDNGKVAFTIADGTTDFIVGDTFTLTITGAARGAVSLPVAALSGPIPAGTMLNFGLLGAAAFAPNGAAAAATTIVVAPLEQDIPNGASYTMAARTKKSLPSGIVIGRTIAERNALAPFGPVADNDDEVFVIAFPVRDLDKINDAAVVRPYAGVVIKENYLPGFANLTANQQAAVRARYICTLGDQ